MSPRFLSSIFLFVSWLSAFIIGGKNIKRFGLVTLTASLLMVIAHIVAYYQDWWRFRRLLFSRIKVIDVSLVFGPLAFMTLAVFSITYRFGFKVYLLTCAVLNSLIGLVVLPIMERTGWLQLVNMRRSGVSGLLFSIAVMVYPVQRWFDERFDKKRGLFNRF
jgi:hypothetical protein